MNPGAMELTLIPFGPHSAANAIGVGTLFGEQIALMASDQQSNEIETINNRVKPNWLPPNPFLNVGVKARLFFETLRAKSEI